MNSQGPREAEQPPDLFQPTLGDINSEAKCVRALLLARQNFKDASEALIAICSRLQLDGSYDPVKLTLALCYFRSTRRNMSLLEAALNAL